jgi:release factor glutamine methyltransferase
MPAAPRTGGVAFPVVIAGAQLRDLLVDRLRSAGCVFAEDEAALLIEQAADTAGLDSMVDRRVAGEPLERILGWAGFCGLRLAVAPGVFVPRTRTGLLVAEAVRRCAPGDVLVDLCTGVGAVAAAVTAQVTGLEAYATEIDPVAVDCARRNLGDRARVLPGDLFAPLPDDLRGRVQMITANAPYVPTTEIAFMPSEARDHENLITLDGGSDGLDVHRRIVAEAPAWLRPGGVLLIETGRDQVATDLGLLAAAGLTASVITDEEIGGTVVVGRNQGGHRDVIRGRSEP